MVISLAAIASYLKSNNFTFEISGNDIQVQKLLAFSSSVKQALCYFVGPLQTDVSNIRNSIIICEPNTGIVFPESNSFIFTKNPQLCFYIASSLFQSKQKAFVHPQALITSSSKIGSNVSIGPFSVLDGCEIGDNVVIGTGVKIESGAIIGNNVVIESNTVIGATGVLWAWDGKGSKVMCAQTGRVIIRDGVFLGSNITIVRGAFENTPTMIGFETMISHGTMIGHGAIVGDGCHFANNVSLAGSVTIGNNCFLGSGVVVRPHISIPDNAIIGAGAVVVKNFLKDGLVLAGNPAREMERNKFTLAGIPTPYTEKDEKE